ncbi:hypothetical protein BDR26DRAFT_487847 [Obelidium mucronatum]|nr:hypothetical protein BDR26DRAFT_487847 [Obelidium mucronatum]
MGADSSRNIPPDNPTLPFEPLEFETTRKMEDRDTEPTIEAILDHKEDKAYDILYKVKRRGWERNVWIGADRIEDASLLEEYRKAAGLDKNRPIGQPKATSTSKRRKTNPKEHKSSPILKNIDALDNSKKRRKSQPGPINGTTADYEFDKILAHRVEGGETFFEVKWVGWKQTTWEPANNFSELDLKEYYDSIDLAQDAEFLTKLDTHQNLETVSEQDIVVELTSESETNRVNNSSEDESSGYETEEEWKVKRSIGPRTARFFPNLYRKFYQEDAKMTHGRHRYDYSASDCVIDLTLSESSDDEIDYDESNLQVGDFVEINWALRKTWISRVTAICEKGVRVVNLY